MLSWAASTWAHKRTLSPPHSAKAPLFPRRNVPSLDPFVLLVSPLVDPTPLLGRTMSSVSVCDASFQPLLISSAVHGSLLDLAQTLPALTLLSSSSSWPSSTNIQRPVAGSSLNITTCSSTPTPSSLNQQRQRPQTSSRPTLIDRIPPNSPSAPLSLHTV
jgi:hypothetical protein